MKWIDELKLDERGLIPAIVQDINTGEVRMVGYMNKVSLQKTIDAGKVTFWSRSRNKLWTKGETSGNFLNLKELYLDCDQDTLLCKVVPQGPTCHTGHDSCFYTKIHPADSHKE